MLYDSHKYRIKVEPHYRFAVDALEVTVVRKEHAGYVPLTVEIKEGELLPYDGAGMLTEQPPISGLMPRELAESLLSALAACLLSADGNLVKENRDLKNRLDRVTRQLEQLIAGIGKLGGA